MLFGRCVPFESLTRTVHICARCLSPKISMSAKPEFHVPIWINCHQVSEPRHRQSRFCSICCAAELPKKSKATRPFPLLLSVLFTFSSSSTSERSREIRNSGQKRPGGTRGKCGVVPILRSIGVCLGHTRRSILRQLAGYLGITGGLLIDRE